MHRQPSPGSCRPMLTHVVKVSAQGKQAGHQHHFLRWTITSPQCTIVSIKHGRAYELLHVVNISEYWLSYCYVPSSPWTDFCLINRLGCSSMFCSNLIWCEVWLCKSFNCSFPPSWLVCLHFNWPMGKTVRNLCSLCIWRRYCCLSW